jgi:hypothetical protein
MTTFRALPLNKGQNSIAFVPLVGAYGRSLDPRQPRYSLGSIGFLTTG